MAPLLEVRPLALADVLELVPKSFGDGRGYFREVFNAARFAEETGRDIRFVQSNQSHSVEPKTLRGLHFQLPPYAQTKLVWAVRGAILDVAVDLRAGSPTYGRWCSLVLSAERGNQILIPAGFAHGLLTLEPDTVVQYMVDAYYAPSHDRGIRYDDPTLAIDWRLDGALPTLSPRDAQFPYLGTAEPAFAAGKEAA